MKTYFKDLRTAALALAIAFGLTQASPILLGQSQNQDQKKSQTFVGKVVKAQNGQYALLTDERSGQGVYLDDQARAKTFEGKNVKVVGILDVARNTVHVTNINPA